MKTRILLALMLLLTASFALGQTAPACNGFDSTGKIPMYFAPNSTTGTTACTDYFGSANYANSPLPIGPVDTSITGFTVMDGGKGYSATPSVTITDFYGMTPTVITCTATVSFGKIAGIGNCSASTPDFMAPVVNITDATGSGAIVLTKLASAASGGIHKFIDPLPDLKAALAVPDKTTFPGSVGNPAADFYVIGLVEYKAKLHSDLLPTTLRGYCQLTASSSYTVCAGTTGLPTYLGPVILAQKDRPVRVLFKNMLPTGTAGKLFIPVDKTYMGAGVNPDGQPYLENRATLHLHGGATPWISDGTPHQWTVPGGDWQNPINPPIDPSADNLNRGVSTRFVPDMWFDASGTLIPGCQEKTSCPVAGATNDPGNGNMTFYWTNQQGGRLMFYHDHAYGLTRLNVYVGEAAGYLLADPVEEDLLQAASVPGTVGAAVGGTTPADLAHVIPLVIQDKSFVPSAKQLTAEDPTWNVIAGGGTTAGTANPGDLWFPHVYMPNQNPNDTMGGSNAFGRWDYGAWFFPPQTSLSAATPPTAVTIPCVSTAFLGQLLAPTSAHPAAGCPITPNPSGTPEAFMDTPLVNGKAYPVLHVAPEAYRFHILSAGNDRTLNLSLYLACGSGGSAAAVNCSAAGATGTEVPMVPAVKGGPGTAGYVWPDELDGRDGGVPDSTAMGPGFVQIGTEGGLLPNVSLIPPTPVGYNYARRDITVLNVTSHGLLLGPAERADAIVDFTGLGGKTLILYNDAPAPVPAFDSRIDYYTGDADAVATGGAPTTLPGYGPNTRTIMQIVVDQTQTCGAAPAPPCFSLTALQTALPAVFKATQPVPIVPEPTYPVASGGNAAVGSYAGIQDNSITFTPIAPLNLTEPCNPPAAGCVNFDQKAIQELFTLDYGRMNATMGTEIPLTTFQNQTTIPYGYVDWPTEVFQDGQTQIWKLTHNGVDTHFIHFHLFNVQVINRIGWDGVIKPPDDNELGWKDTVRMNPLEDIVFALKPISQKLPFPLPDSIRSMDVTMPDNTPDLNISGLDPNSGNATITNVNQRLNFGWEYVWHCHILGHEENDMMRSMTFQVAPPAPSGLAALITATGVNLTFTDNSASETSFTIESDTDPNFLNPAPTTLPSLTAPNTLGYGQVVTAVDSTVPGAGVNTYYRVRAEDNFGPTGPLGPPFSPVPMSSAWSNVALASPAFTTNIVLNAPSPIVYGNNGLVTVTVTAPGGPVVAGTVTLTVNGVAMNPQLLNGAGATTFTLIAPAVGTYNLVADFAAQGSFLASSASGTLVVIPATLTITANNATKTYGQALAFTGTEFTATGLVNGDTVTGVTLTSAGAAATAAAGTYPIVPSSAVGAGLGNYTISYVNGTLTVNRVALTVTAPNPTRVWGFANPVLTPTITGFANGENSTVLTAQPTCTTTATATSAVGSYPITCIGGAAANYTFTYVPGTLTVTTAVQLTPAALVFGTQNIGTTSPSQPVTLRNIGGATMTFSIAFTGNFVRGGGGGGCGTTLAASATCTINVRFRPTATGLRTGTLTVASALAGSGTVALSGTGNGAVAAVTPTANNFGGLTRGQTSAPFNFTVTNNGTSVLTFNATNAFTLGGANPGQFTLTTGGSCANGQTLAPLASCTFSVTFAPRRGTALGTKTAIVRVRSNATNGTQSVSVAGTAQ